MTAVEPEPVLDGGDPDTVERDPFDVRLVRGEVPGLLRPFNDAGVLAAADVHVALCLGALCGDGDEESLLAAALAVRAPRRRHVCVDLGTVASTVDVDADDPVDLSRLPWPDPDAWLARLSASPLVAVGTGGPSGRPLRLSGPLLYLERYWRQERQVAADLQARSEPASGVDTAALAAGLGRLFRDEAPDYQRLAAATAVLRRLAVIAGGPGTGKTTTVAKILALLDEQAAAAGAAPPRVALVAPTGKAATRLAEAVQEEAGTIDTGGATGDRLRAMEASTIHRLLGWRPGGGRFRHGRDNRLPHDVVVVDETSMVSLSLMASLVEAVRPSARLVLVGDPHQLASVEAGAVLGDIVGPARAGLLMGGPTRTLLAEVAGQAAPAGAPPAGAALADSVVVLQKVYRFGEGIGALARAVLAGDDDTALRVLSEGRDDVTWIPLDTAAFGAEGSPALAPVREAAVTAGQRVVEAARDGDAPAALAALGTFRLLCAHRRGPHGVAAWMGHVEAWLGAAVEGFRAGGPWYAGRPLLVTENDYGLRLFNGDTGVVVDEGGGRMTAVFDRRTGPLAFAPSRLGAVETVYAMTVHKAQGSQFDTVAVVLPDPGSPILTRELLYTAATRARRQLILVGTEDAMRAAVARPIARSSGLQRWLWGEGGP